MKLELIVLLLIKTVHDNYSHIQELETLGKCLDATEYKLIVFTTQNSHYDYSLYTRPEFQDPNNHIDAVLDRLYPGQKDQVKSYRSMYMDLKHK